MTRRTACLFAFATLGTALTGTANIRAAEGSSVKGTWVGYYNVAGTKVQLTLVLRADGTYKTVVDYAGYITVEKGKYTYSDGILETEVDGGASGTYTVKFEGPNTMILKGNGLTITYKR